MSLGSGLAYCHFSFSNGPHNSHNGPFLKLCALSWHILPVDVLSQDTHPGESLSFSDLGDTVHKSK